MTAHEVSFTLPRGYIDSDGVLPREGTMRLATLADELMAQRDPRVQHNPQYMTGVALSRVLTRLGTLDRLVNDRRRGRPGHAKPLRYQ